jgi:hypothetical protein
MRWGSDGHRHKILWFFPTLFAVLISLPECYHSIEISFKQTSNMNPIDTDSHQPCKSVKDGGKVSDGLYVLPELSLQEW